jgi:hypothetical protein
MKRIALPSAQSLLVEMRVNRQALSTGTAFVALSAAGPVLVTNRHNVTGRDQHTDKALSPTGGLPTEILVVHNHKGFLGQWLAKVEPLYVNDRPRWREHPYLGRKVDVVALPLTQLEDVELLPYDLQKPGPDLLLGPADPVSVIGFPFGHSAGGNLGVWATGFLASEPAVDYSDLPLQLIDCRTRQGQSGSPVIAYRSGGMIPLEDGSSANYSQPVWRFVGVYSGRINAESDLGIVWKAKAVLELLQSLR